MFKTLFTGSKQHQIVRKKMFYSAAPSNINLIKTSIHLYNSDAYSADWFPNNGLNLQARLNKAFSPSHRAPFSSSFTDSPVVQNTEKVCGILKQRCQAPSSTHMLPIKFRPLALN